MPAVFVIGNDAAWGEIRIPQLGLYGDDAEVATRLAPTPLRAPDDAFGGHAEHVERPDELAPALERALGGWRTPAIVNVMLDPDAMAGHAYRGMLGMRQVVTASPASPLGAGWTFPGVRCAGQIFQTALARITPVVARGDRPQRVARLHDVRARARRATRRAGEHDPGDEEHENETGDAHEHMYAS